MTNQELLAVLARAKALFQQRTLLAVLREMPVKSKPNQERGEG